MRLTQKLEVTHRHTVSDCGIGFREWRSLLQFVLLYDKCAF